MKILKWIGIVIISLIAIFLIYSASQPSKLNISESIEIKASPNQVYDAVVDFKGWSNWSIWHKMDTTAKQEYSESFGEIGSYNQWWSENPMVGNGKMEIVAKTKNEYMKTAMTFEGWDATNYAEFILTKTDEGNTKVEWTYLGSETPFYLNFMNTMLQPMLASNYQTSLKDLKSYVEAMPKAEAVPNPFNLEVIEVEGNPIISILDSTDASGISEKLGELYTELTIFLETSPEAEQAGMPLAIYHKYSEEKVILEAAIPFKGDLKAEGRVMSKMTPAGKVVKGIHYGDYDASESMHYGIGDFIEANGWEYKGSPWEVYANDPAEVDSAAVETHIYYPI